MQLAFLSVLGWFFDYGLMLRRNQEQRKKGTTCEMVRACRKRYLLPKHSSVQLLTTPVTGCSCPSQSTAAHVLSSPDPASIPAWESASDSLKPMSLVSGHKTVLD